MQKKFKLVLLFLFDKYFLQLQGKIQMIIHIYKKCEIINNTNFSYFFESFNDNG